MCKEDVMNQLEKEFTRVIKTYKDDFYRLAFSYLKHEQDALDAISEMIYKGYKSLDKLRTHSYLKTWLYRILINECNATLRKRKQVSYEAIEFATKDVDIDLRMDIENAIDGLSEKYRDIIILRYKRDMSLEEISQVLQLNVNTVKTRLRRALEKLRSKEAFNEGLRSIK